MIKFDRLWMTMEDKGVTEYMLREECGFDYKAMKRFHANENTETKTLDKLCSALNCRIEDIIEYVPESIEE